MTDTQHSHPTDPATTDTVGARTRSEVERAHRALEAIAAPYRHQTQYSRGALAGYLWALAAAGTAPVTGVVAGGGPPSPAVLTAEADATAAQLANQTRRTVPRDYLRGVHDALAWVCSRTDHPPMTP